MAGLSPFSQSYIVGFGTNAPTAPHHRNDCTKLNDVRLKGGVVSGPSPSGAFDADQAGGFLAGASTAAMPTITRTPKWP